MASISSPALRLRTYPPGLARICSGAGVHARPTHEHCGPGQYFTRSLEAFFASVASFHHTVTNVWNDVDAVITELKVHYTRLDGAELTLPCCNVFRIRDGAVADYRVYMDINPVYA